MATLTPRQRGSFRNVSLGHSALSTPTATKRQSDGLEVGDRVEMQGMDGIVKFIGEIKGKPGYYVGAELSRRWAEMGRGKNSGDAGGHRYFTCSVPGAGIFIPLDRVSKISSPANSAEPPTPTTPSYDISSFSEQDDRTPPTSHIAPKFSQSVSGRPPSPAYRPRSRPSLPRPESPVRRTPQPQVNTATPANRPSLSMLSQNRLAGPKFANSPTPAKPSPTRSPAKGPNFSASVRGLQRPPSQVDRGGDDEEIAQLKAIIQEKNDKIASLSQEFDNHRADFRSTLDALELASSETERVYEKRVEDLLEERKVLVSQGDDVESVAQQLRQLEDVVQELEEGLEDARRGEAEARGEVEFLRGEVERVRAELRRERDKNASLANGHRDSMNNPKTPPRSRSIALATPPPAGAPGETDQAKHHSPVLSPRSGSLRGQIVPPPRHSVSPPATATPIVPTTTTTKDEDKWCALCEQDGHDSISCPFDN